MSEDEPRLDLAGNPLPALPKSSSPGPPPLRPVAPVSPVTPQPFGVSGPSYASRPAVTADTEKDGVKVKIALVAGGVLLALIVLMVVLLIPKHTSAPTTFAKYAAADKSFSCDVPSEWTVTAAPVGAKLSDGSESTVGGALFEQNSASIDVTTDTYATLMAYDVMNNNADPQSLTGSKAGVLHKQWHKRIAAEHKGYTETQIADFQGQSDDARLAEWTGAGNALGFGGQRHGYRASFSGGGKTAVVVCSCLDSDWPALKPAFQRALASFVAGEAAPPEIAVPDTAAPDTAAPDTPAPTPNSP